MRGLPISRGKLYPGYRLFRRLRFVVGGNRRERSSNERVARPLDAPLVFARRRFIEILFLWPARARADSRRGRCAGERRDASRRPAEGDEREPSSSHFLRLSSPFPNPSVSLYPCPHCPTPRPASRCFASSHALRYAFPPSRASARARVLARSLAGISPGRDLAFSPRPALLALRPFNSIATPFYNAAAPCSANGSRAMAPNASLDPPTRDLAILHERRIPSYLRRSQGMRVTR